MTAKISVFYSVALLFSTRILAQPTITSFSPASGPIGATVTITGTNFSTTPANNIVYFGTVKATVNASTSTSLTVTVPLAVTYQPIAVTTNGLTAYSTKPFVVTFTGAAPQFNDQSFEYAGKVDSVDSNIETTKYTIGDLDNDGKLDVVTVDRLDNTMSVYRNTTIGGVVSFASKVDFTTGQSPRSVSVGDIDGDGKLDIAVSNLSDNTVSIYRNTTSGATISFAAKVDFGTAIQPAAISITDVDKDGKPDLVVNTINLNGYVSVLRNTSIGGNISFATRIDLQSVGGSIEQIRTADLDGDGRPDIVIPNYFLGYYITIFRNTSVPGSISFASKMDIGADGYPDELEIGDLNNDGKPDLAVSYFLTGQIVSVFRNTGSPGAISFDSPVDYSIGNYTDGVGINDLDGDGKVDIAVCTGLDSVSILKNASLPGGAIAFSPVRKFQAIWNHPILTGDFDSDGKPDIAMSGGSFRAVIFRNKTTEPQITSFSPTSANIGTTVTIHGFNFSGVTSVKFGGVSASSFVIVDPTTITAVVDTGGTGDVVVISPNGSSRRPGFVFTAPPVVTSFSPTNAATGTSVTISGKYFSGTTAVSFGGTPASSFTLVNSNTISAVVGSGASGSISVTTQFGTGSLGGFTYLPIPTITSFSPTIGGTGSTIAISGTNFSGITDIKFGGIPASSFTVVSPTLINAVVGAGTSGSITVTNAFGTASINGFIFKAPPVITSFTPVSGQTGAIITITGHNFNGVTHVQFGGVESYSFAVVDSTTITAEVGQGASGSVTVVSPYGMSSLAGFTFLSPPIISSFSPSSGPIGASVTIIGSSFSTATAVYFGGVLASSFSVISDDTIIAVTGIGNTGPITVINQYGSGFSNSDYTFEYPIPTISSFTPTSGASGTAISITGSNFLPGRTIVRFGGVVASSIIVNSSSSLTATVGAGASGDVVVITPGGSASMPGFTYIPPPPVVTQCIPLTAVEGIAVSVYGSRFTGATAVAFGGVPAKSFVVNTDSYITAIVGPGTSGEVSVTTSDGTGTLAGFVYGPVTITSFSPTSGTQGSIINIAGSGFLHTTSVTFGGTPAASITVNSMTSITATVAAGNSGLVRIVSDGISGYKDGFSYVTASTSIGSVSPTVGGAGTVVTINGSGFIGTTAVSFGGTPAASFTINSSSSITATIAGGSSGNISVNSPAGTGTFSGFIFTNAPVISTFTPDAAMAGTYITITGSNFNSTAASNVVYFGGVKAKVVSASANSITVLVPIGAPYEYISVTNNGLTGYSQKKFRSIFLATDPITSTSFQRIDSALALTPKDITTADFDLDGKPDVIVCNSGTSINDQKIAIFKNSGSPGVISFLPKSLVDATSTGPIDAVSGDIDGDGKLDLIVGNARDGTGILVYKNTSNGNLISFGNGILLSGLGLGEYYAACIDVDLDGKPDIISAAAYSDAVAIYRNTSNGGVLSFATPVFFSAGKFPQGVSVSDLDGDGKPEIVFGGFDAFSTGSVRVLRNTSTQGNISFAPRLEFQTPGYTRDVAIADIDGDGKNDILLPNEISNTLSVFRNLSSPGYICLDNKTDVISFSGPFKIAIGDLDGNDKPDVVAVLAYRGKISIYPNTSTVGKFSFDNEVDIPVANNPTSVTVADIDLDQRPDIITANTGSGSVSFLRNTINGYFLSSFTPSNGSDGTVVTITGVNLSGATGVSFGGKPATSFIVLNSTTITAVVGDGSSGDVSVTLPGGTISLSGFTYNVVTATRNVNGVSNELRIYPNPAMDHLVIEHPSTNKIAQIQWIDASGRLVKINIVARGETKTQVSTKTLSQGTYQVIWTDGTRNRVKTVLILK